VAWNAGFSSRAELQITFIEKLLRILVQSVDQRRIRSVFTSRQRGIEGEMKVWPDSASIMAGIRSVLKCDFVT